MWPSCELRVSQQFQGGARYYFTPRITHILCWLLDLCSSPGPPQLFKLDAYV